MAIIPNFVERLVFKFNVAPPFMLDYLSAQAFRANAAAFKLGVYTALSEKPFTAPDLAQRLQVDQRGLTLLLDTLEALGYVKKNASNAYALTPAIGR